jgi:hypothetical protein
MTGGQLDTGAYEWSAPAAAPGESPALAAWALTASPNPFAGRTTLRFVLPHSAQVRVTVWDAAGRRLGVALAGVFPAGCQTVTWGPDVAGDLKGPASRPTSGLYFVRLEVDGVPRAALKLLPLH